MWFFELWVQDCFANDTVVRATSQSLELELPWSELEELSEPEGAVAFWCVECQRDDCQRGPPGLPFGPRGGHIEW